MSGSDNIHKNPNEKEHEAPLLPTTSRRSSPTLKHPNTPSTQTPDNSSRSPHILRGKTGRLSTPATIAVSLVCAVVLAIVHHIVLNSINGHDVRDYSQFWIKNISNAFATSVAFFLGRATTDALSQVVSISTY